MQKCTKVFNDIETLREYTVKLHANESVKLIANSATPIPFDLKS